MRRLHPNLLLLLVFIPFLCYSQKKIKPIKNAVVWSYLIEPKSPLPEQLLSYDIQVKTTLDPMDYWDRINWSVQIGDVEHHRKEELRKQAIADTIRKWSLAHLALERPYLERNNNPDFSIVLETDAFSLDNLQLVEKEDYSDPETVLGEINISARLTVVTQANEVLLDEQLKYYIDDLDGSQTTLLKVGHFMVNPSFKLKFRATKKPEKKRKLLEKRLLRYQADILEYFVEEAGKILKDHYLPQKQSAYAATYGIKNKGHEALNEASEDTKRAILALSSFSKKKRKSWEQVKPQLETAMGYWKDKLQRTTDQEIQKYLHANLSLGALLLNDHKAAQAYLEKVPEYKDLDNKGFFTGSFIYYLKGLKEALSIKERANERVRIYQL
nr:hypothetical protein [Allomuricauda sp.]